MQKDRKNSLWSETETKTLLSTPVMEVISSTVHCERSNISKSFYRFDFPSWVNIVAVTEKVELVIIKQYRFGTGQLELEIPGGAIEEGEDPLQAGLRELLEETGFKGDNGRIIGKVCPNPALQNNDCYTVFVENVKKIQAPNFDDMEDIEVQLIPVDKVFEMVKNGTISHGLVLNGLLFYQNLVLSEKHNQL